MRARKLRTRLALASPAIFPRLSFLFASRSTDCEKIGAARSLLLIGDTVNLRKITVIISVFVYSNEITANLTRFTLFQIMPILVRGL